MKHAVRCLVILLALATVRMARADVNRYFVSPQESARVLDSLLRSKDWAQLASYCDLEGSGLKRADVAKGAMFTDEGSGAVINPFPPGWRYAFVAPAEPGVVHVTMTQDLDQGDGRVTKAVRTYALKRHPQGYRLLPPIEKGPPAQGRTVAEQPPAGLTGVEAQLVALPGATLPNLPRLIKMLLAVQGSAQADQQLAQDDQRVESALGQRIEEIVSATKSRSAVAGVLQEAGLRLTTLTYQRLDAGGTTERTIKLGAGM